MGKETTQMIQENFADVIGLMTDASVDGAVTEFQTEYEYQPFCTIISPDMSGRWKGLDKGGAAKVAIEFCDCCECDSNMIAQCRPVPCQRWCASGKKCYHWEMATEEMVASLKKDVNDLLQKWGEVENTVVEKTQIKSYPEDDENNLLDLNSINFVPVTELDSMNYGNLLSVELDLRGMGYNLQLTVEQRREKLKERVAAEEEIKLLRKRIERCEGSPQALYLMIQAIPCILHLEMRVGIKILTMVINVGLGNAGGDKLDWQNTQGHQTQKQRKDHLAETVEMIINEYVLGSTAAPGQFKLHFETDRNTGNQHVISPISLTNSAVRAIINDMGLLIDKTVCESDVNRLKCTVQSYCEAMKILRISNRDVTDDEINAFQKHVDDFHDIWVSIFGDAGLTNYIHYLSAGHIAHYLSVYGNLSKYSTKVGRL